jgi:hypothetical protein
MKGGREVLLADGVWVEVQPGTYQPDPAPWTMFQFSTADGRFVRGQKSAILAVRSGELASA